MSAIAPDHQPSNTPDGESTEEFTPTMDRLCQAWLSYRLGDDEGFVDEDVVATISAEFYRAIAAHDVAVSRAAEESS